MQVKKRVRDFCMLAHERRIVNNIKERERERDVRHTL